MASMHFMNRKESVKMRKMLEVFEMSRPICQHIVPCTNKMKEYVCKNAIRKEHDIKPLQEKVGPPLLPFPTVNITQARAKIQ
ncbi:hypothetical protein ACXO2Y_06540 [Lactobacillus delbrueckii subsp. bulgaricus]|nr:hypothetical protein [Lactobacillus delbrueckii subsp. bulgaricus]MBT8903169.1 hypothetical protein [Lactobacillus delbrueckii subsp. bulgaricus]MBT8906228.1 hypothetical protein [Lactobacillus delbrueckii subsp. bulgaricus]MBT8907810.1 hypothetical protein [Lactobacillus delbrueckii subsp. bulgaricus]MBT8910906.1 hypothetical protein [Lactobacillus delbrueckii subsp. bulgaricus]